MSRFLPVLLLMSVAYAAVKIRNISPEMGPTTGNTRVVVRGSGLEPNAAYQRPVCRFGSNDHIVQATYIRCTPDPQNVNERNPDTSELVDNCLACEPNKDYGLADSVPFSVSITGDFTDSTNSVGFQYYTPAVVDYIVPMYGPKNGGTTVTVHGQNFQDFDQYLRCSFGTKEVRAQYVSPTMLYCKSPQSDTVRAGMPFRISMNDQQTSMEDINFYYYPRPSIFKLTPNKGPLSGGNEVLIEGEYMDPFNDKLRQVNNHNDTFCRFGDFVSLVKIYTDNLISCEAPPSPVIRTVMVDITLNNADTALNPQDWTDDFLPYTYYAMPYVYDINPRVGPTAGNTTVIAYGSNFNDTDTISCKFGEKPVPGEYLNENEIKCISPPMEEAGIVDLRLSMEEDNYGKPVDYLYYETPEIVDVSPICGPTTGYTQITITGKNFIYTGPDLVMCVFDDIFVPATVMSPYEIKCDSPDVHNNKEIVDKIFVDIGVTMNGRDKSILTTKKQFGFYQFHTLTDIYPKVGPLEGSTPVSVFGDLFDQPGVCNVTCRYDTTEVINDGYSNNIVHCRTPPVEIPGESIVQVALNGQQFTEYLNGDNFGGDPTKDAKQIRYKYFEEPLVSKFRPTSGPSAGGSVVSILGAGFLSANETAENVEYWVRFNNSHSHALIGTEKAFSVDINELRAHTPPSDDGTSAILSISRNDIDYDVIDAGIEAINATHHHSSRVYTYYGSPTVTDISPNYGPVKLGYDRNVTISGRNFRCFDKHCEGLHCKFDVSPYPIFRKAYLISSEEIQCLIPQLSRPEVVDVEITLNGNDYTHDHKKYSYYDAFVLDFDPHIGPVQGGTIVKVQGYGFADTKKDLMCRFGSNAEPLLCHGHKCEFRATYVSDSLVLCSIPPMSQVTYKDSGKNIDVDDWFDIEVAVHDGQFTNNHIKFRYFENPEYQELNTPSGSANGGTYLVIGADFNWTDTGANQYDIIQEYDFVKCKFSDGKKDVITDGSLVNYPFHTKGEPNSIACVTPSWPGSGTVDVTFSINGRDYSGKRQFTFVSKLKETSIYPRCGPNKGNTRITLKGQGFQNPEELHLKWGNECRDVKASINPKDDVIEGYSATTPTSNTHGGFVYVEVGYNNEMLDVNGEEYIFYGDYTNDRLLYLYYEDPVIQYIFPHGGPNTGGTEVELSGAWYINYPSMGATPRAMFGNSVVDCSFYDTVRVYCIAPAKPGFIGRVPLELSFNGQDWTESGQMYTYYGNPYITRLFPKSGPTTGGTMAQVIGGNFTADALPEEFNCQFKAEGIPEKIIPAQFVSEQEVLCTTPGGWGVGNEATVELTFNGVDFTNYNKTFVFFQIDGAYPQSGPSIGSDKPITVHGSGFRYNENATLYINDRTLETIEASWYELKYPLPPASQGPWFLGSVLFETTVNGVDYTRFPNGFYYYPQPNITDIYPYYGPINGKEPIRIFGGPFYSDFVQANTTCIVGEYLGRAQVLDVETIDCYVEQVMTRPKNDTGLPVHVALNGQDYTDNPQLYKPYGILDISPKGGPIEGGTEVLVGGFGFTKDPKYKAWCRFGTDEDHMIVGGRVIDNENMICVSPVGFKIPDHAALPLDVPLEIGFRPIEFSSADTQTIPWTKSDNKFRWYKHPSILLIKPDWTYVDEQVRVDITSDAKFDDFFPATTGVMANGELDMMHAIVCKFGEFGTVPAKFVDKHGITTLSPDTGLSRDDLNEETVDLEIALNGQDFFVAGPFTFKGNGLGFWVILMWLGTIICIVIIIILIIVCCSYAWVKIQKETIVDINPYVEGRPHVFRDPTGVIRPEGSPSGIPGYESYGPGQENRYNPQLDFN